MQCLTKKNYQLSYIRAIATIFVVILHNAFVISNYEKLSTTYNILSRVIVNISMCAVPLFLMVSGILLLNPNKEITVDKIFKKYIFRMIITIFVFIAIYTLAEIILNNKEVGFHTILNYIKNVYTANSYSTMWYLYMLIGIYILLPLYRNFVKNSDESEVKLILGAFIIFLSILPMITNFSIKSGFYVHEYTIYPFYLLIGYYINRGIFAKRIDRSYIVFSISTILIILGSIFRWIYDIKSLEIFWGYSSILVILQSISLFNILLKINISQIIKNILIKIDNNSFGIYLIHILIIRILTKLSIVNNMINMISFIPTFLIITLFNLVVSYILTSILKKCFIFRRII